MNERFFAPLLRRALLAGILVTFALVVGSAQTAQHYLGLTYIQTLPGKAEAFRKFAETDLVKFGQMGVDEGTLDAYYVARLTAPYVAGSDYNYLQVVWYKQRPSLAPLDMKVWEARAKKAGYTSYQQYLDKRDSMAKIVRTAWRVSTARLGDVKVGSYIRSASYQVEPEYRQEMIRFLRTYTMPLAQDRISAGSLQGWGVSRPATAVTSDDEAGFSFVVSNVLKDGETLMAGPGILTEEVFKKAVPGTTYATYMNELNALNRHRKVVTTRIMEIVSLAGNPPKVSL